ncbi:hypothetical protein LL912_22490 [Niabella sp. CC-SYL272]|uniref:hypothetical protein n=1 Tax=Niabella agricola TaxID=2891571 RepID=UPI001F3AC1BD|nr:hypothetical protein [Niabella agricola]MCF3111572.1 hypothetical protein [Niabella agricola]
MRKILLVLLLIMELLPVQAQDRIYTKRAQRVIEAQVTEVTIEFINYRKLSNPDGPVYTYPRKYVDSIVYANGTADYFSMGKRHRPISREKAMRLKEYNKMGPNTTTASGGILDLARPYTGINEPAHLRNRPSAIFQLSYERTLLNNRLGLDVAPFVGLNDGAYGFGLAMRFYPKNKGRVRVGIGPQYMLAVKKAVIQYRVTNDHSNGVPFYDAPSVYAKETARFSSMAFTGKITVNVNKVLCLSGNVGIGGVIGGLASHTYPENWEKDLNNVYYNAGLGLGIRF